MSREYKNIIKYSSGKVGKNRRREIAMMPLENSDYQLETLTLEDYDASFKKWVEEDLKIVFEKEELPTVALFAAQRFGEFMQSWKHTDAKKNILMNFKVITRDNNPKPGSMYGNLRNIPENKFYLVQRLETVDENGRPCFKDYKMRQPFCVDMVYHLSIVTNKFRMLNLFNELINDEFKSIERYINVKGHYVSMYLDDISDESEYQIDDRQYYSQSYNITVKGYLLREEDFMVEEQPKVKYTCLEGALGGRTENIAEIEDLPPCFIDDKEYKGLQITLTLDACTRSYSFTADEPMVIKKVSVKNTRSFRISKNGLPVFDFSLFEGIYDLDLRLLPGDKVLIDKNYKVDVTKGPSEIILIGYNPYEIIEKDN